MQHKQQHFLTLRQVKSRVETLVRADEVSMRNGHVRVHNNLGNLKIFLTDNMCVKLVNEIVVYMYVMTLQKSLHMHMQ